MKVLSLLQPWATLVITGVKKYEVRSWQTKYRGALLIHASAKKPSRRERLFFEGADYFRDYIDSMDHLPYGAIIGEVNLVAIHETGWLLQHLETDPYHPWSRELVFDDYTPGRFAWKLTEARELGYVLPLKGTLGLWEYKGHV
jgi:activating signal cointegrator 1